MVLTFPFAQDGLGALGHDGFVIALRHLPVAVQELNTVPAQFGKSGSAQRREGERERGREGERERDVPRAVVWIVCAAQDISAHAPLGGE